MDHVARAEAYILNAKEASRPSIINTSTFQWPFYYIGLGIIQALLAIAEAIRNK